MSYFPVSKLKDRFGIGKQADINRRKHLGIVPKKVDGIYVIDEDQLSLLDQLDEFLKSSPKAKMTDFQSTGSTVPTEPTRPILMEASLDSGSDLTVSDEESDWLLLVERIATAITPPNPIANLERLLWLANNNIEATTSQVQALTGAKPHGTRWTRGSFTFIRSGLIGNQYSWLVVKKDS